MVLLKTYHRHGDSAWVEVEMERYAPLGDPAEIKLRGNHLSLRKEEADGIILE